MTTQRRPENMLLKIVSSTLEEPDQATRLCEAAYIPQHFERRNLPVTLHHRWSQTYNWNPDGTIHAPWKGTAPLEAILLGAHVHRGQMLQEDTYSAHAALVVGPGGDGKLLVGHSGAGKTTLAGAFQRQGYTVASGNTTLLRCGANLVAVGGTTTISARETHTGAWEQTDWKEGPNGRLLAEGPEQPKTSIIVREIVMVRLENRGTNIQPVAAADAAHHVFGHLWDYLREDLILGGEHLITTGAGIDITRAKTRLIQTLHTQHVNGSLRTLTACGRADKLAEVLA